jgi:hypothetical protein
LSCPLPTEQTLPATANNRHAPHRHVVSRHAAPWSGSFEQFAELLPDPVDPESSPPPGGFGLQLRS